MNDLEHEAAQKMIQCHRELAARLDAKLEKALAALRFYALFDFKGNPHFQAIAREALKEIETK